VFFRLGWKSLLGANTLAYYKNWYVTAKTSLITFGAWQKRLTGDKHPNVPFWRRKKIKTLKQGYDIIHQFILHHQVAIL
jgi:hypothetical protein